MTETETTTRPCPSCRQDVRADATRCRHCYGDIADGAGHGGRCPLCREDIHPEATRCPHCKSSLVTPDDCGCDGTATRARSSSARVGNGVLRAMARSPRGGSRFLDDRPPSAACPVTMEFRDGTYDFVWEDDDYCYYWGPQS